MIYWYGSIETKILAQYLILMGMLKTQETNINKSSFSSEALLI